MSWTKQTASVLRLAVISTTCGSLASVCGKLAFDTSDANLLRAHNADTYFVRGLVGLLILLLNSTMLSFYVRLLQAVSALQASLLAFVFNYVVTTIFGILLFHETISLQWALGAVLMTAGAFRAGSLEPKAAHTHKKKKQ